MLVILLQKAQKMPSLRFGAFGKKISTETESLPSFLLKPSGYSKNYRAGLLSQSLLSHTTYLVSIQDTV